MNYYLLSVTNDFESQGLCKEIAISLSPIVDTPNLKFHYTRNQILFSFGSETEKSEIYDYIYGVLYGLVEIFVLTEIVDEYSVYLPKDIKDHLSDLENVGDDVTMKIDMSRIKQNLDFSFEDDDEDDDFITNMIYNKIITPKSVQPTLDQLLDKLCLEGMDSLSVQEREILETYSKN
jgi:hypothetical protein